MPDYTPGKWEAVEIGTGIRGGGYLFVTADGRRVAEVWNDEYGHDNVRLIASAPSLLEALEWVNLLWGRGNDDWTPLAYWEAYPESRERTFNEEAQRVGAIMESAIAAARGEVVPGA